VVEEDQDKADDGKVEQVSPISPLRLQAKLVVNPHGTSSHKIRQRAASEDDEDILRDEVPRGVAGSKESRLFGRQHAHVVVPSCMVSTYMVLQDMRPWEAINFRQKRRRSHGADGARKLRCGRIGAKYVEYRCSVCSSQYRATRARLGKRRCDTDREHTENNKTRRQAGISRAAS
jgi:hypothetical protein